MADRAAAHRNPLRVALVNMPFGSTRYPSIQLGLLQAILKRHGITADTHYLNLQFGRRLGWEPYEALCDPRCHLLGEWLFARAAFGEDAPDANPFLDAFPGEIAAVCEGLGWDRSRLLALREREAPAFVRECLTAFPWDRYDVVGFGTVFEQNCATLALARSIKERFPRIVTVFGGANFEDEMGLEYVRALPWIDYAVIGEGDESFPALLAGLARGEEVLGLPGVARREGDGVRFPGPAPMVRDLDGLPEPDYGDYFRAASDLGVPEIVQRRPVVLPFESARGCWWGAKHHCTFCGLNGLTMAFRSKSPARVLAGIDELANRYPVHRFFAVDNIMDHRYVREVFTPLAERRTGYTFFYEVKANLTREQLAALARAGVRALQPGVESLSSHVLKLMDKGTTAIQNVRLLKWAGFYGIGVGWNILTGFPGERPEDYQRQLATLRLIPHLQPPAGRARILLERFSPNFTRAEELGIRNIRPHRGYAGVYPPYLDHQRIAYFFDYDAPGALPEETHRPLEEHLEWWQRAWQGERRPQLRYLHLPGLLVITDDRQPGNTRSHTFDGRAALAYEFCGPTHHGAAQVLAYLRQERGLDTDLADVQRDLDGFTARGLMMEEDGHYLSLAQPLGAA